MRTQALIIKKQYSGEYNQLYSCYTPELGKILAVAKSSLRSSSKQAMHLDVLSLVSFELINPSKLFWGNGASGLSIIASAQSESQYAGIKGCLPVLGSAYFFLEVLDKIVFDHQPDLRLWDFYVNLFNRMDADPQCADIDFFRDRQTALLDVLGYKPAIKYANLKTNSRKIFSGLDGIFEQTASRQFSSLKFLFSVI